MCELASFHHFKGELKAQNKALQENNETEHDIIFNSV